MCQVRAIKLLMFGVLVGLLLQESSPHPANGSVSKERKSDSSKIHTEEEYDEYDDEDEPTREGAENDVDQGRPSTVTQLLTKNQTIEAELGQTLTLQCRVQNRAANTIIIWYNTSHLLFMQDKKHTKDDRISLSPDNSLVIRDVQYGDDSKFKCLVLPIEKAAYFSVHLPRGPHDVRITHGNTDYTNRDLEIQQRDRKFIIHCHASGFPTPSITWSFRGKHLDDTYAKHSGIMIHKAFLEIHDVKPHHSGDYECLAQNGIGDPVSASVNVHIKSSPTIVKHIEYMNTAIGKDAELTCLFHSNPQARKIQWLRGDELLHSGSKYQINDDHHNHHDRTRLTVRNIEQKDLVAYHCKIENALGETSAKTVLGLLPGAAHLINSSLSNGQLHTVWRVRSVQLLTDLQILYKGESTKYTTVEAVSSSQNREESNNDSWIVHRSIRIPEGEWFITARAKNNEGWSYTETVPTRLQIPSEVYLGSLGHSGSTGGTSDPGSPSQALLPSVSLVLSLLLGALLCRLF